MNNIRYEPLVQVLLYAITRATERIERAQAEIIRLKEELKEIGFESISEDFWKETRG